MSGWLPMACLEMRHGEGTFVAGNASRRRFEKQRRQFVDELGLVVRRGLMLGISARRSAAALRRGHWKQMPSSRQSIPSHRVPREVNAMPDPRFILNVRKRFGKHDVLRGMNLTVERGQIFALLGRNGAGKTTLIRLLLGPDPARWRLDRRARPRSATRAAGCSRSRSAFWPKTSRCSAG